MAKSASFQKIIILSVVYIMAVAVVAGLWIQAKSAWIRIPTKGKFVFLTFDDGPSYEGTPRVLELLKRYDVNATFFMSGYNLEDRLDLAKGVVEQGHDIGNHGHRHLDFLWASPATILKSIEVTDRWLYKIQPRESYWVRLPYGRRLFFGALALWFTGREHILFETPGVKTDTELKSVLARVQAFEEMIGPGSILLFHDGPGKRDFDLQVLAELIPKLLQQGYRFLTISEGMSALSGSNSPPTEF